MTTISDPLPPKLEEVVNNIAKQRGSNKAEVVRSAIVLLAEHEAVMDVLAAEQEPTLSGDLLELSKKIKNE